VKAPHLCWVLEPAECYEPLIAAARERRLRVGWLHLAPGCAEISALPELAPAVRSGASRAVGVGAAGSVELKPIAGEPVLADLVRGHFLGCSLVLISGDPQAPGVRIDAQLTPARLSPAPGAPGEPDAVVAGGAGGSWRLITADGRERVLSTDQLLARLRRPRL